MATAFSSAGNGCGRPRGLAVPPVVGVDGRWGGDVDFSERHRPLPSVGTADIGHNIAQERQVKLMGSLKFARLLRMLALHWEDDLINPSFAKGIIYETR